MFLYLVDEYTSKPVYDPNGLYPKIIQINSQEIDDLLPVLRVGLQAVACVNGALGLLNMFFPGIPAELIPEKSMAKAEAFTEKLDFYKNSIGGHTVVKKVVEEDSDGGGAAKRGSEFLQFVYQRI